MMFHYSKTSEKYDEWIEFGSPRIFEVNSKVVKNEKRPKNAGMDMSLEKQPSVVECPMAKTLVIHTADDVVVEGNNVVSETSDANESQHTEDLSSLDQTPIVFSESVVSRESFTSNNKQGLYQDEFAGRRAEGLVSYGSESLSASEEQGQYPNITAGRRVEGGTHQCGSEPLSSNVWYTGDDLSSCSRVYGGGMNDRMQDTVALCPVVSVDRVASHGGMYAPLPEDHPGLHQQQNSSSTMHSGRSVTPGYPWNAASGFWQSSLGHTEHRDSVMPGSMNNNYNNNRVSLGYGSEEHRGSSFYNFHGPSSSRPVATAMPNSAASFPTTFGLSGLDMLAAVTNHHFVGTSSSTSPIDVPNNNNFGMMIPAHHGFGHRATIMNAAPSQQHPFGMQPPPHPPMGLNPPGPFPSFSNRPMG